MAPSSQFLKWPRAAVPVLRRGGRFPMPAHNPGLVYVSPETIALHLHNYAGKMWLGSRLVRLQPGDFTLTPARMPSNYDLDEAGHHVCIHFDAVESGGAAQPSSRFTPDRGPSRSHSLDARGYRTRTSRLGGGALRLPLHWRPGPHAQWLSERLQEIIHLFRLGSGRGSEAALARLAAGTALQGLLLWIVVMVGSRSPDAGTVPTRVDGALDRVRRHLDEHYRRPLDVPVLAKQVGVSQNHLARRFRARHGMTLQRYVLGRRIELARHLLAVTRLPLKAVAIESGLGNPQYFHRQFRRATGHSPSEERKLGEGG